MATISYSPYKVPTIFKPIESEEPSIFLSDKMPLHNGRRTESQYFFKKLCSGLIVSATILSIFPLRFYDLAISSNAYILRTNFIKLERQNLPSTLFCIVEDIFGLNCYKTKFDKESTRLFKTSRAKASPAVMAICLNAKPPKFFPLCAKMLPTVFPLEMI